MIIFSIALAIALASSAILLYTSCAYAELKGYERGLKYAEQIICEQEVKEVCNE